MTNADISKLQSKVKQLEAYCQRLERRLAVLEGRGHGLNAMLPANSSSLFGFPPRK